MDVPGSRRMISNWQRVNVACRVCRRKIANHSLTNPSQPSHATENVRLQRAVICDYKLRKAQSDWVGTRETIDNTASAPQAGQIGTGRRERGPGPRGQSVSEIASLGRALRDYGDDMSSFFLFFDYFVKK
jgi:hypothetical protein